MLPLVPVTDAARKGADPTVPWTRPLPAQCNRDNGRSPLSLSGLPTLTDLAPFGSNRLGSAAGAATALRISLAAKSLGSCLKIRSGAYGQGGRCAESRAAAHASGERKTILERRLLSAFRMLSKVQTHEMSCAMW